MEDFLHFNHEWEVSTQRFLKDWFDGYLVSLVCRSESSAFIPKTMLSEKWLSSVCIPQCRSKVSSILQGGVSENNSQRTILWEK
jgi:hypothetical protein